LSASTSGIISKVGGHQQGQSGGRFELTDVSGPISTYIFVWDDFYVLNVSSSLKYLAQDVFGHTLVETSNI